jgi:hypothetical protein
MATSLVIQHSVLYPVDTFLQSTPQTVGGGPAKTSTSLGFNAFGIFLIAVKHTSQGNCAVICHQSYIPQEL